MMATLAATFGGLALTLTCIGLYGLLAYGWRGSRVDPLAALRHE